MTKTRQARIERRDRRNEGIETSFLNIRRRCLTHEMIPLNLPQLIPCSSSFSSCCSSQISCDNAYASASSSFSFYSDVLTAVSILTLTCGCYLFCLLVITFLLFILFLVSVASSCTAESSFQCLNCVFFVQIVH